MPKKRNSHHGALLPTRDFDFGAFGVGERSIEKPLRRVERYYGLAIGLVPAAGLYGAGAVSGLGWQSHLDDKWMGQFLWLGQPPFFTERDFRTLPCLERDNKEQKLFGHGLRDFTNNKKGGPVPTGGDSTNDGFGVPG